MYDQVTICRTKDAVEIFYTNKPYFVPRSVALINQGASLEEIAQEIYEVLACLQVDITTVNPGS